MFDIGWPELLMVAVVMILVVGPKDLPPMLRAFGRTVKKYRGMANDFKNQFNEALEESELDELRQTVVDAKKYNPLNEVTDAVKGVGDDINEAVGEASTPVKPWTPKPEEISDVARSVGEKSAKTAKTTKTAARKAAAKTTAASKTSTARKAATAKSATKTTAAKKSTTTRKPAASSAKAKTTTAAKKTGSTTARKPRAATAKTGKGKAPAK